MCLFITSLPEGNLTVLIHSPFLLQLENLMLDEKGHIKIIDFGHCREGMYFGKTTQSFCGDPHFIPPEVGVISLLVSLG